MNYTAIYKNGKVERFFIKATNKEYKAFLQNYFTLTSLEHPKLGRIKELFCLFSVDNTGVGIWSGRQYHGYGYASSADVYGELLNTIEKLFENTLTAETLQELNKINTHDDELIISDKALDELTELANGKLYEKWEN